MISSHPFAATFVSRGQPQPGQSDSTMLVERSRYVGNGMREDIVVRNLGHEPATCTIAFELDADFAHIFEVKENRVTPHGRRVIEVKSSVMTFSYVDGKITRGLDVAFPLEAEVEPPFAKAGLSTLPRVATGDAASSSVWWSTGSRSSSSIAAMTLPATRLRSSGCGPGSRPLLGFGPTTPSWTRPSSRALRILGRCRSSIPNTRTERSSRPERHGS